MTTLDVYTESIRALSVDFTSTLFTLFYIHMFFIPATRNSIQSSSIEQLEVSPSTNQALVTYKGGNQYLYSNIEEGAMFDILFYNVKSFGKWVNDNCKKAESAACFPIAA